MDKSDAIVSPVPELYFFWRLVTSTTFSFIGFRGMYKAFRPVLRSNWYPGDSMNHKQRSFIPTINWRVDIPQAHLGDFTTTDFMLLFLAMLFLDIMMHKAFYKATVPFPLLIHHIIAVGLVITLQFLDYGYGYMYMIWSTECYPAIGNLEHLGRAYILNNYRDEDLMILRLYQYKGRLTHIFCLITILLIRAPVWSFIVYRGWANPKGWIFCKLAGFYAFYLDFNWARYHVKRFNVGMQRRPKKLK
mmetsp:Transcript_19005/g.26735  ORF Transcript_19005/g.26735 Transcript_19005/m.26735 type:complete len:246 (-) Transcript_19005:244-981(-)